MADFKWSEWGHEIFKTEHKWNVKVPFLEITDGDGKDLKSSIFSEKESRKKWLMQVNDMFTYLHINVLHVNNRGEETKIGDPAVLVKFAIVDGEGQKRFQQMIPSHPNSKYVQFSLTKQDIINSKCQLTDGSLTFYCKIQSFVRIGTDVFKSEFASSKPINCSDQLLAQLETMLGDGKYCDVTFVLRGREYKAHKNILASRSKVFEAMFKQKTKDILNNPIVIEDIEPEVFQVLLRFMYTGQVTTEDIVVFATALYVAADKYQLDQLKIPCENHLFRRPMSAVNCFESLFFTSNYPSAEKLKQEAIKFFRPNPVEVMETDGWKKADKENRPWVSSILKFFIQPADNAA